MRVLPVWTYIVAVFEREHECLVHVGVVERHEDRVGDDAQRDEQVDERVHYEQLDDVRAPATTATSRHTTHDQYHVVLASTHEGTLPRGTRTTRETSTMRDEYHEGPVQTRDQYTFYWPVHRDQYRGTIRRGTVRTVLTSTRWTSTTRDHYTLNWPVETRDE